MTLFNPFEISFFVIAVSTAAYFFLRTHRIERQARGLELLELREAAEKRLHRFGPGRRTCEL